MEKKKKLIILGVILLLIIVSGATFAILTWNSTMIKLGINTNCFTIDYTRGGDITGSLKLINWGDIYSEENNTFTIKKGIGLSYVNVGINSNCSIEGYGTIYLNVTELSDTFKDGGESSGALKYAVLKNTSNLSNNDIKVDNLDSQSFELLNIEPIMETGKIELYSEQLSNTEVNKYLVVIFIIKQAAGNDVTEATFKGNISVEAEQKKYGETPEYCFNLSNKDETNKTAYIDTSGYKCYDGNSDGYETITDVIIPERINGYKVIGIQSGAFCTDYSYNGQLTGSKMCSATKIKLNSVRIPDTVDSIGEWVFSYTELNNVILGKSVKWIGGCAFCYNNLIDVEFPTSLESLGRICYSASFASGGYLCFGAFEGNKIESVTIPDSVTEIGEKVFSNNNLSHVYISENSKLTIISEEAFSYNQLTSITIPDLVTSIGKNAFSYNNLNNVYIGNNSKLTNIRGTAFSSTNRTYTNNNKGITYVDNPNLKTIYYNGSNQLPWVYAINGSESSTKFVTGTVPSYTSGTTTYNEVLITTGQ